ncbi:sialidase family protein [Mycolicibacterium austroafricanum]|uniref:Sialidase family protein n=1 Tax=Mycolicibacterium austroafricanum TaxID=39687 RepID=A0ABT8HKQ2_MYCAO|nr:sialidase family protein [Mycolicibacterium austroafricanum]MDN4521343.1 sialidase family protein [Mycolicibacterium austroafricanum]
MALVTITGNTVRDGVGRKDNRPWYAWAADYQDGNPGVITPRKSKPLIPSNGVLSFEIEAGISAWIENPDGQRYLVTIPLVNGSLWEVIEAGVAYPPETSQLALDAAVVKYIEEHRAQFGLIAVPVPDSDPPMAQWVRVDNGEAVGDAVPWSQVIDEAIAQAAVEAEAPAAVGQAAAELNITVEPGPTPGKVQVVTNGVPAVDEFNPYPAMWEELPDKPLGIATRTNLAKDPDYDFPTAWVNSFTTGTPTVTQDTYTFSDGTTRKGAKVSFASTQPAAAGAIRMGRVTHNDIAIPASQPVTVQVRVVSSIAQRLYVAAVELPSAGTPTLYYTWSDVVDVPAGGDGVLFTVKIPQTQATAARMQVQVWPTRGVAFTAGSWLFVTGVTVEQSSEFLGPIFSGNDPECSWSGTVGQSSSTTATAKPVKDARAPALYGTPTVGGNRVSVLRDGLPTYLTDDAWEPPRTRWGRPRRVWEREATYEGWPNGCLATDGEFIYHAYHDLNRLDPAPRSMKVKVRRQRVGAPLPGASTTLWDETGSSVDADVNAVVVAPNGDVCVILRTGTDTFPLPAPTLVGNYLVRSTDQGATWDSGTEVLDNIAAPINVTSFAAPLVTEAGTTLATGVVNDSNVRIRVLRNTTADLTGGWTRITIPGISPTQTLIEGAFVQFKGGLIGVVMRPVNVTTYALISYSTDDGLTWSNAVESNLLLNNNPATIIYDPDSDTAEILCGSRPKSWITSTVATADDFVSGTFGAATPVIDMINAPNSTGLGYPAALRLPDGRRLLRFMDLDVPTNATIAIFEAWGRVK